MSKSAANHRKSVRYEVDARVDCTGEEIMLNHRIQNLSLGGLCMEVETVEPVGTIVDLLINFPDLETSIQVSGEVVWANDDPPRDMGIRFFDLDSERKETLRLYLDRLEET